VAPPLGDFSSGDGGTVLQGIFHRRAWTGVFVGAMRPGQPAPAALRAEPAFQAVTWAAAWGPSMQRRAQHLACCPTAAISKFFLIFEQEPSMLILHGSCKARAVPGSKERDCAGPSVSPEAHERKASLLP
jgi:hypothetical protein